jgi:hypothetical protein
MFFTPRTVRLHADRPPDEVRKALSAALKDATVSNVSAPQAGFQGRVDASSFELTWSPAFNRQLRPLCLGRWTADGVGTRLDVEVRPHRLLPGFAAVWAIIAVPYLWTVAADSVGPLGAFGIVLLALGVGGGLFTFRHRRDVGHSVRALCEAVGARVQGEPDA